MPRSRYSMAAAATPHKEIRVPLNDDRQEKATRRHAQRDSMIRAATPSGTRLRQSMGAPQTPAADDMPDVAGTSVTPMKRDMPLMANWEEWIKMSTENKFNPTNSWNFALIDYFHEMSLLKEGDGVNFHMASCTLDGCVKIYTSRVDSVATDTGKLLSGLAESGNKKRRAGDPDGEDGEDEDGEEGEDGQKKKKKRAARTAEQTLAPSFEQLQNKKMELELSVDPLFKKASADFDEGGAKGLLLNHLAIDAHGRIVFDSSDDADDAVPSDERETPAPEDQKEEELEASDEVELNISALTSKYFPDLALLDEQDVCPSMKTFDLWDADGSAELPFLKAPEDWRKDDEPEADEGEGDGDGEGHRSGVFLDEDNALGFDDDDVMMGVFDLPTEAGFGEGGEVWANEAARDPQARVHTMDEEQGEDGDGDDVVRTTEDVPFMSMTQNRNAEQEAILAYFDQTLKKNWAGPKHWRVTRVKQLDKTPPPKRKEKEPFKIDFDAPMNQTLADMLYTPATSKSTIELPKAQWKSKSRNLLPDDKHFNSRQLMRLFLKPKSHMGARRGGRRLIKEEPRETPSGDADEAYWAAREAEANALPEDDGMQGNYDANFFQDDGLPMAGVPMDDGETFADARDHFSPPPEDGVPVPMESLDGAAPGMGAAFGSQLVTQNRRLRPEYVQYARVAKKVDVKRLKDELWTSTGFEEITSPPPTDTVDPADNKAVGGSLKFTQVVNNLQTVYPQQAMADISTSYCFICLLHLANEKGLVINNDADYENLTIRRDFTADLSVGD
ncbi:barren [Massarina eburnea CBS 473.64]|uniref:Condensin complex subunit 2 n=1 Tax=Massarina eburnea CBS 473.64 TaxID=1395130 RepID=A0A6A6SDD1_9PLEO|nr:barren [Massarina eburnea CBS 473.64]